MFSFNNEKSNLNHDDELIDMKHDILNYIRTEDTIIYIIKLYYPFMLFVQVL